MPPTAAEPESGRWEKTPVAVRCDACNRLIVAGARMLVFERQGKRACRACGYGETKQEESVA